MKRSVLAVLMCMALLPALAQNLRVQSFSEAANDLSAMTRQRLDLNNNPCAMVKVYVLDDITAVEGEAVGNVVEDGNEKLIYLCDGVKQFRLKFKYHYPLTVSFTDYGMTAAKGNAVYVLEIVDGNTAAANNVAASTPVAQQTAAASNNTAVQQPVQTSTHPTSNDDRIKTFTVNGVSFRMIKVDGGTFMMGADEGDKKALSYEKPRHQVTLSDYYIGETEVTQALWKAVMGSNPSYNKGNDLPVEDVSWDDCQEFVNKLNDATGEIFSLPTEAQWEFAARGGNKSHGYKYSGSDNIGNVAWYSGKKTHPVGSKQPNELGIYDMSGNVREWCSDWFNTGYYSSSSMTDPSGPSSGSKRVSRGGWYGAHKEFCRLSQRDYDNPSLGFLFDGLRLALRK